MQPKTSLMRVYLRLWWALLYSRFCSSNLRVKNTNPTLELQSTFPHQQTCYEMFSFTQRMTKVIISLLVLSSTVLHSTPRLEHTLHITLQ